MNCLQKGRETIPSTDAVTQLLLCQISSIAVGKDWLSDVLAEGKHFLKHT